MDYCKSEGKNQKNLFSEEVRNQQSCYQASGQPETALGILSYWGLFSQAHTLFFWHFYCWCLHNLFAWTNKKAVKSTQSAHIRNLFGLNIRNNGTFSKQFVSIWSCELCESPKSMTLTVEITSLKSAPEWCVFKLLHFLIYLNSPQTHPSPFENLFR